MSFVRRGFSHMNQMASTAVMTQMFAASLHMKQPRRRGTFQGNVEIHENRAVEEAGKAFRLTQFKTLRVNSFKS